jgi:hypothetical protein
MGIRDVVDWGWGRKGITKYDSSNSGYCSYLLMKHFDSILSMLLFGFIKFLRNKVLSKHYNVTFS